MAVKGPKKGDFKFSRAVLIANPGAPPDLSDAAPGTYLTATIYDLQPVIFNDPVGSRYAIATFFKPVRISSDFIPCAGITLQIYAADHEWRFLHAATTETEQRGENYQKQRP